MKRPIFIIFCIFWLYLFLEVASPQTTRITSGDATNLNGGLMGWWPLDDNGATTSDRSGNGRTGTLTNAPATVRGKFGNALEYALSSSQWVSIPTFNCSNISITAWVFVKVAATHRVVSKYRGGGSDDGHIIFDLQTASLNPRFIIAKTGFKGPTSATALALNRWYFLAGTYDNATVKLYINGVLNASSTNLTGAIPNSTQIWTIGGDSIFTGTEMVGTIDDVKIYSRDLTAGEVSETYNTRKFIYESQ